MESNRHRRIPTIKKRHGLHLIVLAVSMMALEMGTCATSSAVEVVGFRGTAPTVIEELEVVHVAGQAPTLTFKTAPEPPPPRRTRPTGIRVNLLERIVTIDTEKNCVLTRERSETILILNARSLGNHPCRLFVSFAENGATLDILSYQVMALRGEVSAPASFALADARRGSQDAQPLLKREAGPFDISVSLRTAAQKIDLRDMTTFVIIPRQGGISIRFDELTLVNEPPEASEARRIGFWVWDYHEAMAHTSSLLDACRSVRCGRLAVQMPGLDEPQEIWLGYATLLRAAQEQGIEAFGLDGYPEAILDPQPLIAKVNRLRTVMQDRLPTGLQLDIEPYLLEGFFNDSTGFAKYLDVHTQMKRALAGEARLSVVMPFWLTSQFVGNKAVAFAVMDLADEVALMSYRTDLDELRGLVEDTLRYGDLVGVPAWLGVETRALPLEEHVRLQRVTRRELATAYLDRDARQLVIAPPPDKQDQDWFRIVHRTAVRPDRLTFSERTRPHVQGMITTLDHAVANRSFAGVLIHDYAGFFALPEQ